MALTYRLAYFNGKGRAEVIRYLFHLAKVPYVDERFSYTDFMTRKEAGEFVANFGRVPVLFHENEALGQSRAIERYLARKFGYFGSNEIEGFKVDVICEHCRDVKDKYTAARDGKKGDELATAKADFVKNDLPGWFTKLESSLGDKGYAVGSTISLADLYLYNLSYDYFDLAEEVNKIIQSTPKVKASADMVKEALKDYLTSRPVTPW